MSVQEMTFGIEIETHLPMDAPVTVGHHGSGMPIDCLPGWNADADPSIRAPRGRKKCEFVSPIYKGSEGLAQFLRDLAVIRGLGAKVNASCGLHIHVGFNKADAAATERLVSLASNFEKAIYATTGTKSRERGRWCNGLNGYRNAERALQNGRHSRYHVLNLATGNKPTVEFRAFAGSTNARKIVGYIRLCVGLVEKALESKRVVKWDPKTIVETSPCHRDGIGQTALARMFYGLGWTKGDSKHVFGDLTAPGAPSIKSVKKTFVELAKKYDTQS